MGYEAQIRRDFVRAVADQMGIVRVGSRWIPKPGDSISGLPPGVNGPIVVATNCSGCLIRGMGRLVVSAHIRTKDVVVLAPEASVLGAFRKVFPDTIAVIDHHAWQKFRMEPYGPPFLYVIEHGQVMRRLP